MAFLANRGAFYLFLAGTLSSLVLFLALTVDTHRQVGALTHADRLSDQVVAGKHVWESKNCNECHTILGFGIYYAPDLTRVYQRIGSDGIKAAVGSPEKVFAGSIRKMPNLHLTDQEIADLTAFLQWTGDIDNHDWPPQDTPQQREQRRMAAGFSLSAGSLAFRDKCMSCHAVGGSGGSIGPALDTIGDKYDAAAIVKYVSDPASVNPASAMPAQKNLTRDELQAIADFLAKQKGGA